MIAENSWNPHLYSCQRTHSGEKLYECHYCKKQFSKKSAFILHQKIHMESNSINVVNVGKTSSRRALVSIKECMNEAYKCNQCGIIFSQNDLTLVYGFNLNRYQNSHNGEKLLNK